MQKFIFLSPNTAQFTYENIDLQGKEICFSKFASSNNEKSSSNLFFSEKHISGFSNILSLISSGDVIYFTLPANFNYGQTIQFVYDLTAACKYNRPSYIIFDRSRCISAKTNCSEKLAMSLYIQHLLEDSDLPVIYLNSTDLGNHKKFSRESKLPNVQFQHLGNVKVNLCQLEAISKKLHQFFDLKGILTNIKEPLNTRSTYSPNSINYSYTLN